ncbi:MAG: hypothetical protein AB8F34_10520 [Akkermansiaceae bacterium]
MSEVTPSPEAPVCKPTKWFLWRALAMLAMFSVFAILFFKDGMWGYREKNLHFYVHAAFTQAGKDFQELQNKDEATDTNWKEFASEKKVVFPDDAADVLPRDAELEMAWPDELVNGFELLKEKGGQPGAARLWENFTSDREWDAETEEKPFKKGKITEQFWAMGVTGVLIAITLFFLIRTMSRKISADEEALHTQDGRRIAYADMVRIDKRKWDTKGLALIYYNDGEEEKKAKIDGMVYGQFKEEDGAPAEKLFAYVMERFKGEVIEYADLDEEPDEDSDATDDSGSSESDDRKEGDS